MRPGLRDLLEETPCQWLFSETELQRTPSILDGLNVVKERENRGKGVNFILQVGIMLKLPQITLATASVFLHRFYCRHSMPDGSGRGGHHHYSVAATSLFLATKVDENCRKMKEFVVACVRVAQKDPYKVVDEQDKEYWRWRDNILMGEDILLEALCFDLQIEPPYKILYEMLMELKQENNKVLRNAAWAFLNDSCLTVLCLIYRSKTIAASALYAAARHSQTKLDDVGGVTWWQAFGESVTDLCRACNFMADVYQPRKSAENGSSMYSKIDAVPEADGGVQILGRATQKESRPAPVEETSPRKRVRVEAQPPPKTRDSGSEEGELND